jgi:hypothetical protein
MVGRSLSHYHVADEDQTMPTTPTLTASATVSLTGALALQGRHPARGLQLWASADQIQLQISVAGDLGVSFEALLAIGLVSFAKDWSTGD